MPSYEKSAFVAKKSEEDVSPGEQYREKMEHKLHESFAIVQLLFPLI